MADVDVDDEVQGQQLRLLTITGLWLFPRYLHMLGRVNLSAVFGPISLRVLQFVAVTFVPVWVFLSVFDVSWSGPSLFFRVTLPLLVVWWGLRQAANGGRVIETGRSIFGWWLRVAEGLLAAAMASPGRGRQLRGRVRVRVAPARQVVVGDPGSARVIAPEGFDPGAWELLEVDDEQGQLGDVRAGRVGWAGLVRAVRAVRPRRVRPDGAPAGGGEADAAVEGDAGAGVDGPVDVDVPSAR